MSPHEKVVVLYESSLTTKKLKPAFFSLPEAVVGSQLTVGMLKKKSL